MIEKEIKIKEIKIEGEDYKIRLVDDEVFVFKREMREVWETIPESSDGYRPSHAPYKTTKMTWVSVEEIDEKIDEKIEKVIEKEIEKMIETESEKESERIREEELRKKEEEDWEKEEKEIERQIGKNLYDEYKAFISEENYMYQGYPNEKGRREFRRKKGFGIEDIEKKVERIKEEYRQKKDN